MNRASFVCHSGSCSCSLSSHCVTRCQYVSCRLICDRGQDTNSAVLFLAHGNRVSILRLKQFTVLTPPNTTYCLLCRLYTLIKMSHFLKRYAAGKMFRYFSYDFSFYMKSLSTILSLILSKQQVIIVTHLYVLSVSISVMRKHV
jgi:hypothetical protein